MKEAKLIQEVKRNHFYFSKDVNGRWQIEKEPIGKECIELAVIAGGADLLAINVPLCKKHLVEYKEPFVVNCCSGFQYVAVPISAHIEQCRGCNNELFLGLAGVYLSGADLSGADLSGVQKEYAAKEGAILSI